MTLHSTEQQRNQLVHDFAVGANLDQLRHNPEPFAEPIRHGGRIGRIDDGAIDEFEHGSGARKIPQVHVEVRDELLKHVIAQLPPAAGVQDVDRSRGDLARRSVIFLVAQRINQ